MKYLVVIKQSTLWWYVCYHEEFPGRWETF